MNQQGLGAAKDAARMQRVVSFYEKLPRGQAPDLAKKGFWGNYQKKHFGEKPTAKRMSTYSRPVVTAGCRIFIDGA